MDCVRDDLIFQARLKQWHYNVENSIKSEVGIKLIKKTYEPFETMPKPSTPKQARQILKFVDMCLERIKGNYEDYEEVEEKDDQLNIVQFCCCTAQILREYIRDETKANDALTAVLCVRRGSDDRINSIVFNEDDFYLLEKNETKIEAKNDEQAKLKMIEIFHTINIFAKNAFDKIHDAHRVKRLFK